jgi:hypothetical protein
MLAAVAFLSVVAVAVAAAAAGPAPVEVEEAEAEVGAEAEAEAEAAEPVERCEVLGGVGNPAEVGIVGDNFTGVTTISGLSGGITDVFNADAVDGGIGGDGRASASAVFEAETFKARSLLLSVASSSSRERGVFARETEAEVRADTVPEEGVEICTGVGTGAGTGAVAGIGTVARVFDTNDLVLRSLIEAKAGAADCDAPDAAGGSVLMLLLLSVLVALFRGSLGGNAAGNFAVVTLRSSGVRKEGTLANSFFSLLPAVAAVVSAPVSVAVVTASAPRLVRLGVATAAFDIIPVVATDAATTAAVA